VRLHAANNAQIPTFAIGRARDDPRERIVSRYEAQITDASSMSAATICAMNSRNIKASMRVFFFSQTEPPRAWI
jgi:hypothetical protein